MCTACADARNEVREFLKKHASPQVSATSSVVKSAYEKKLKPKRDRIRCELNAKKKFEV